jgi:hypothetical protein
MKIERPLPGNDQLKTIAKDERLKAAIKELEGYVLNTEQDLKLQNTVITKGLQPLSRIRHELEKIAHSANLSNQEEATAAIRKAASVMVRRRLKDEVKDTYLGKHLIKGLSDFIATDPMLQTKLLSILTQLQTA